MRQSHRITQTHSTGGDTIDTQVLIVGAGPTGLVLALGLARRGIDFVIVDRNAGPGEASRAMAVHARTLEFYQQFGFADTVVDRGIKVGRLHLKENGVEAAVFEIGDFGEGLSPFPFVLSFPQDEHERLLLDRLRDAGADVRWNTQLIDFEESGERIRATVRTDDAESVIEARYLCGCDGVHSAVREGMDVAFPGGTYDQMFYVADVDAHGEAANGDFNMCLGTNAFCAVFPIRTSGSFRLIGIVPDELRTVEKVALTDIQPIAERLVGLKIQKENWFSTYHVHHRVAGKFRTGRAFLAGDAGHVHSPAGGQGMNTGIGDAVNLSWKLASVVTGRADSRLLDTYEAERIAFARLLVSTTDKVFTGVVSQSVAGQVFRKYLVPNLVPFLLGFSRVRTEAFRMLSQTRINYRASELSVGVVRDVHGGDRLPWVQTLGNFEPLRSMDWQIHVYGSAGQSARGFADERAMPLFEFAWCKDAEHAGFSENALYLVRPDGYVAVAAKPSDTADIARVMDDFGIGRDAQMH